MHLTGDSQGRPRTETFVSHQQVTSPKIEGLAREGIGVRGAGSRGGLFAGDRAQVRLKPSNLRTHPASGLRGDLFVDDGGRLWFCRARRTGNGWRRPTLRLVMVRERAYDVQVLDEGSEVRLRRRR